MKNTGALLKSKRESSSLSLSEVALATKINPKILAAIENGDESNLPAKTFLKGFVRSYALYLKMDVDEVMRSFQDEMGGPPPERVMEPVKAEPSTPASRRRVGDESSSGMRTIAVVVIVVLIGLIIGVRELIEKYQRERVVESTAQLNVTPVPPAEDEKNETGVQVDAKAGDTSAAPAGTTPAGTEVKVVGLKVTEGPPAAEVKVAEPKPEETKPAEVKPVETKVAEVKPAAPVTEVKPVEPVKPAEVKPAETKPAEVKTADTKGVENARPVMAARPIDLIRVPINNLVELRPNHLSPPKPIETKPAEVKPAETKPAEVKPVETKVAEVQPAAPVAEVKPVEPAKPADTALVKAARGEIILEALDKVEVKFQVNGETKRVSLGPSQVHTIHAELPMTLDLSDGGAVNVILNGRERGVPGDLGKPKTIKIP